MTCKPCNGLGASCSLQCADRSSARLLLAFDLSQPVSYLELANEVLVFVLQCLTDEEPSRRPGQPSNTCKS